MVVHADTWYDHIGLAKADQAAHHDYHHTINTGNFGVEWLDWLCGTEDGWVQGGLVEGYFSKKANMK